MPPQLDYIDPRAVQLGSLLVRGLTTLVLVNSACGFPWGMSDFMPWNVFDGKLFHQKYLQSEKGYTVEALVEQNVSPWCLQGLRSGAQVHREARSPWPDGSAVCPSGPFTEESRRASQKCPADGTHSHLKFYTALMLRSLCRSLLF